MSKKNKCFYIVIDLHSQLAVTTMPTYGLCQGVVSNLPERSGYKIVRVPHMTKMLDPEFSEEMTQREILEYYAGIKKPISPKDWYTNTRRTDMPDSGLPVADSALQD